ncbi:MAG: MotA/TolQ/ExbB proton channel family protein [Coriobacteriales bacterium]|jgi:biopolymer transport protein ExbB/TolQ|nr:MotA/TolQ/ExbB proton channel family protein [Coriobacteriales bacterium]
MANDLFVQYLSEILHRVAQFLMVPVMLILAALILFALFCLGSLIAEVFTERQHFKVNIPQVINDIHDAPYDEVEQVVVGSRLLAPQKAALLMAVHNMGLTADELFALAKMEIVKVDDRYKRTLLYTEQVTKIAPMMGLMCTLIPLGPGIVAMGQGDVNQLSMSLLVAFDGTVAGLVAAVVSLLVTGIRKRWYNHYLVALESLMTSVLDKAETARTADIELPHDPTPILSALGSSRRESQTDELESASEETPYSDVPDPEAPDLKETPDPKTPDPETNSNSEETSSAPEASSATTKNLSSELSPRLAAVQRLAAALHAAETQSAVALQSAAETQSAVALQSVVEASNPETTDPGTTDSEETSDGA